MDKKLIYKNVAEQGNRDIVYMITRSLLPFEESLEIKIDKLRLRDELLLYKYYYIKGKGSIVSALIPIILSNPTYESAVKNAYDLFSTIRKKLDVKNKIGINFLVYYIFDIQEKLEFAEFKFINGSKIEEIEFQKSKIKIILQKYSIEEMIVDSLDESEREFNIVVLESLKDKITDTDDYLNQMSMYFQRVCLFQVNKKLYNDKLDISAILNSHVNQNYTSPVIGEYYVKSKEKIEESTILKLNAKMGEIQLAYKSTQNSEVDIYNEYRLDELKFGWKNIISKELEEVYFQELLKNVSKKYRETKIYPPKEKIFEIFTKVDIDEIKVVIIGQDPYHGANQANGMCFSVNKGVKNPPSLKNIFEEINNEFGILRTDGDLSDWVYQGVLLLNSILTVEEGNPGSHKKIGWEKFTNRIISELNQRQKPIVFLLWGNYAIDKAGFLDKNKHYVLISNHPSPLSSYRGFFGNNHFRLTNDYLITHGEKEIIWA